MKKLLSVFLASLVLMCGLVAHAGSNALQITLNGKGWHVVSTPAILSSIQFSNGGYGISFSKLENGQWVSVPANATNIKPLEGYMVYNNNTSNVTMTLNYKTGVTANESLLQKSLNYGWNLLGIVTISYPFNNITGATMSVDFTNNGSSNLTNRVNSSYKWNTVGKNVTNLQLGEAYGMFINERESIYGGVNNGGAIVPSGNADCDDPMTVIACTTDTDACPEECRNGGTPGETPSINLRSYSSSEKRVTYGEFGVSILSGKISVQEPVSLSFNIKARNTTDGIEEMTFIVGDEEYNGHRTIEGVDTVFKFYDVIVNQTENFGITVDIKDDSSLIGNTFNFSPNFDKDIFTSAKSINTNEEINRDLIGGSITLSTVSIQFPEITEKNSDYSEGTEFYLNQNTEKRVFDLKYSVTKGDVYIDSIYIDGTEFNDTNIVSLKCKIGGNDVGTLEVGESNKLTFTPIKVENNKNVYIYVYATIDGYEEKVYDDLEVHIDGKDSMGHSVRQIVADIGPIKVLEKKVLLDDASTIKNRVVELKGQDMEFVKLLLKSNTNYDTLRELTINFSGVEISANDIRLVSNYGFGRTYETEYPYVSEFDGKIKYSPNLSLEKDRTSDLSVALNKKIEGDVEMRIVSMNNKVVDIFGGRVKYVPALVTINSQRDLGGGLTKYTFNVSHYSDETTIQHLTLSYTDMDKIQHNVLEYDVDSTSILEVLNTSEVSIMVNGISYYVCGEEYDESNDLNDCEYVEIKKADFPDFFLVNGVYAKVFGSD